MSDDVQDALLLRDQVGYVETLVATVDIGVLKLGPDALDALVAVQSARAHRIHQLRAWADRLEEQQTKEWDTLATPALKGVQEATGPLKRRYVDILDQRLQLRKVPEKLAYDREDVVRGWCAENLPDALERKVIIVRATADQYRELLALVKEGILDESQVKAEPKVLRKTVAAHWEKTGEIPPGCSVVDAHDTLKMAPAPAALKADTVAALEGD